MKRGSYNNPDFPRDEEAYDQLGSQFDLNPARPQQQTGQPFTDAELALIAANRARNLAEGQARPERQVRSRGNRQATVRQAETDRTVWVREKVRQPGRKPKHRGQSYRGQEREYLDYEDQAMRMYDKRQRGQFLLKFLSFLLLLASISLCYVAFRYRIGPLNYRLIAVGVLVLINLIVRILRSRAAYSRPVKRLASSLAVIFLALLLTANYFLYSTVGFLNSLNILGKDRLTTMSLLVMKESPYTEVSELTTAAVYAPVGADQDRIDQFKEAICEQKGVDLDLVEVGSYFDAVEALYSGQADAIMFNSAYTKTVESHQHKAFRQETRSLFDFEIKEKTKDIVKRVQTDRDSFTMYISGIDTYGPIESVSRSDVNIVMSVNPLTRTILLTNIPRDTYVPISGGGHNEYDKLTHAGIYGVQDSVDTVANLLDEPINYYSRVNFTSLIEMVDVVGGITVDNPVAFPSNDGNYYFEEGPIDLDGEAALAFSRERYNLAGGDGDRGKNQQRVLTALLKKIMSPAIISNYGSILSTFQDTCETNMPTEDIMDLVNLQISDSTEWKIESNQIFGTGRSDLPSYAMPGYELYMLEPDEESVAMVRQEIDQVLGR